MINSAFYFILKALFFLRYSSVCPDFLDNLGKGLDKKTKVNFKIYDATNWITKNYDKHIARYLKK